MAQNGNKLMVNLRVCSFNVRGFRSRSPMVHRLIEEEKIDILFLQETLVKTLDRLVINYAVESLGRPPHDLPARGSTVLCRRNLKFELVIKDLTQAYGLILGKVSPLFIGGVYIGWIIMYLI